ncbi:peptidase propeptide and YpeB domain protein [Streptomyces cyaneogriseus subsp. noncyanogenus]|uniref:Peptidase propeptide and YpeB domain protein n=1 Tax=Streptomyces cyaneogriseus subsp. noncyanogenus TaxID=477245 RepID=A0A0C5GHF8_9ACTN|nr:PepSY domain-containing protein [Streptomyces cyaneogriseus]AJP03861.1 peptidase propeptide and YpeB domain protein [Streptomyces cyaneogriseus subsp. noncyanogenus]
MKRNIVIAAVTAAALITGGTATALAVSGNDGGTARQGETRVSDDDAVRGEDARDDDRDERAVSSRVTAADAIAAALRHTPGTAVSAELEDADDADDGEKAAWDVDVLSGGGTWHSVRVDPATGKVLGSHADDDGDDDTAEVRAALKGTSVSAAEAARAAAVHGTVTSVDLDDDDRRSAAWDVETRSGAKAERDWTVDPGTGKVAADRSDDGADGADDDANDGDDD